jgi:hypothetical protein
MVQKVQIKYINESLHIGIVNWKEAYLLYPAVTALLVEVDRGRLIYRLKGSAKRISYATLKKGLVKKSKWIRVEVPDWLPY